MTTEIHGECDPRFLRVKKVFAESFASGAELGAAVAITVDGGPVVDLWGGIANRAEGLPWAANTLVNLFSTTKGLTAMCAHHLVDEGRVDLDAPIADLWPEFGVAGKERITLRWLLSHRAGLPAIRETLPPEAMYDWDVMTGALAAEAPWWEPGTTHGYHAVTLGWLVGEVIRRVTGMMPGAYFREVFAGPLGLDAHIGLAASEDARCATLQNARRVPDKKTLFQRIMAEPASMTARAFTNPATIAMPGSVTSRAWRGADIPSVNGHATARAIAKLYGVLAAGGSVDGVRVLSREAIARCAEEHSRGLDSILDIDTRFSLGFMLPQPHDPFGREGSFGHPGAGGSIGFADPEARIGFGYVMNRMGTNILLDPRPQALIEAMYASL